METRAKKVSIRIASNLHDALQQEAQTQGCDVGELILRILTAYAIEKGRLDEAYGQAHELRHHLLDRAVQTSVTIHRNEGISRDIQNKTVEACMANSGWMADYARYIGGDPFERNNPKKASINKELGMRIHRAIGGNVALRNGKSVKIPVSNSIIQRYTAMEPGDEEDTTNHGLHGGRTHDGFSPER